MSGNFQQNLIGCWVAVMLVVFVGNVTAQESTPQPPLLQVENETASAVAWNPSGTTLAIGDSTGVLLYSENLEFIRAFEQPSEDMKALAWSPDGQYVAALGANDIAPVKKGDLNDPEIYVWEADTGELITIFDEHDFLVTSLAWSPDGTQIATGSWDGTVRIWNPLSGDVKSIYSHKSDNLFPYITSVSWSPDGHKLASLAQGTGTYIWNVDTDLLERFIPNPHPYPPIPILVTWSPEGEMLATGYGIMDRETFTETNFENCPPSGAVSWHPTRPVLAQLGSAGVIICDVADDTALAVLESGLNMAGALVGWQDSLDWHPDGQRLAGAAGDGFVRIWHVFDS